MQTILYATDLTARADRALERACRLAVAQAARLHVIYVGTSPADDLHTVKANLDQMIAGQFAEFLPDGAPRPNWTTQTEIGDPVRVIVAKIADLDPDLVVLGQSDDVAATEIFQGTSTDQIVSKTKHPVLVVRKPVFGDYKKTIVAFDHSLDARRAFEHAMFLAPQAGTTVVKVIPDTDETPQALGNAHDMVAGHLNAIIQRNATHDGTWPTPQIHLLRGRINEALHDAVLAEEPDLVAFGRTQKTGLKVYIIGSTASFLLGHLICDVLIV